jgi:prenyltransferase beta subunit
MGTFTYVKSHAGEDGSVHSCPLGEMDTSTVVVVVVVVIVVNAVLLKVLDSFGVTHSIVVAFK